MKNYGLRQTTSGHYVMDIAETDNQPLEEVPEDFRMELGVEAMKLFTTTAACAAKPCVLPENLGSRSLTIRKGATAHVRRGQPAALPSMRRSRSSHSGVSDDSVRRGHPRPRRQSPIHGCRERDERLPQGPTGERCLDARSSSEYTDSQARTSVQEEDGESEQRVGGSDALSSPGDEPPHRYATGDGISDRPHRGGDEEDRQESGEEERDPAEEGGDDGSVRPQGRLPFPFSCLQSGGSLQHSGVPEVEDDHFHVEEALLAGTSQTSGGDVNAGGQVEEESTVAGGFAGKGDRKPVWALRGNAAEAELSSGSGSDVRQRCTEIAENEIMAEEDVVTIDNMLKEHGEAITDIYYDQEENNVIYQEDLQRFYQRRAEEREGHMTRPARGLTQKFKKGIKDALAVMDKVKDVAKWTSRRMVLEIFAGTAMVTQVAEESTPWGAYQPIDIIMGEEWDLSVAANRNHVVTLVSSLKPALVVITPPCGPWCAWQRLCQDFDALDELRRKHLPYWRLTRDIWDCQTREGRLALTEQPDGSDALETSYMTGRNPLYRVVVDQCMFGLKDPESHKLYRKTTALDVNDETLAKALADVARCNHAPEEHEQIKGQVKVEGKWRKRSEMASAWTAKLANHVLKSAEAAIYKEETEDEDVLVSLPVDSPTTPTTRAIEEETSDWEDMDPKYRRWTFPVEAEGAVLTPEEVMKRQMRQFGATGEEYDYITFEGQAKLLVRRVRRVLAHLHVTLGHISNDRLHRMLSLAGASGDLLAGARRLRCQVCCMVRPPTSKPQVSYLKPTNFNQRVSGDVFFVWDINNVKYAVVHYIDELTDYHVGAVGLDPTSDWAAEALCRCWYDVFGPPDVLITDGGSEFEGAVDRLNDLFAVSTTSSRTRLSAHWVMQNVMELS